MMKAIVVIADGMGDWPLKQLNGKTPVEAADTPNLDWLAKHGICGIMDPLAPGVPPGSDVAHLSILGYNAKRIYSGRGALEAVGFGVDVVPGDVIFRCNFATVDDDMRVIDRRAGRISTEDASKLAKSLQKVYSHNHTEVQITFINTVQHRAILRLRGPGLSMMVSDSDPHAVGRKVLKVHPLEHTSEAEKTAKIVNEVLEKFHETLKNHPLNEERKKKGLLPANIILCRGAGVLPIINPFSLKFGIKAAAVAVMPLVRGVCKVAGMRLLNAPGATGGYDTDMISKAKTALEALKTEDFILIHVKATDLASHDAKVEKKVEMIEKVDKMVGYLIDNVDREETYIAVTADHTTSSVLKEHTGDPVPVALWGPYVRTDDVKEYSERSCACGGLGRIRGRDLMYTIANMLGKMRKFGA